MARDLVDSVGSSTSHLPPGLQHTIPLLPEVFNNISLLAPSLQMCPPVSRVFALLLKSPPQAPVMRQWLRFTEQHRCLKVESRLHYRLWFSASWRVQAQPHSHIAFTLSLFCIPHSEHLTALPQ